MSGTPSSTSGTASTEFQKIKAKYPGKSFSEILAILKEEDAAAAVPAPAPTPAPEPKTVVVKPESTRKKQTKVSFVPSAGGDGTAAAALPVKTRKPNAWVEFQKQYKAKHGWGEGAMTACREAYAKSKEEKA